jgi:hypothetical protein
MLQEKPQKNRCWAQLKCNNSIRNQGLKEQLHMESSRTLNKTFRQAIELRSQGKELGFILDCGKSVSGHCEGVGPVQNKRRDH